MECGMWNGEWKILIQWDFNLGKILDLIGKLSHLVKIAKLHTRQFRLMYVHLWH